MNVETREVQDTGGLHSEYRVYEHQKCFIGHSHEAEWRDDILSACAEVLPRFGLEPWYAADHFEPTKPLRDKVVELIANARYGIYDLSSWQDSSGEWHLPRNVLIELGIAIVLNRPTLLLRHTSNSDLSPPSCLEGVSLLEFAGDKTLIDNLEKRLPQWLDAPPERDWLNRFCIFGNRVCNFRELHPCIQPWEQQTLCWHIADGLDGSHPCFQTADRNEIREAFREVFDRYNVQLDYLDEPVLDNDCHFALCHHCRMVRSTPFAIYRILPYAPAETFVVIGMNIALGMLFEHDIPKILLVRREQDLPSLLRGYEVVEAANSSKVRQKLKPLIPAVMQMSYKTAWKPKALPFVETVISPIEAEPIASLIHILVVDDNPDSRSRLCNLFQRAGWKVSQAQTNVEALNLLTSQQPFTFSLVTTDILRRPERAGEEGHQGLNLVRDVNQRFPELSVILITTYSNEWVENQTPGLKVDDLLDKRWSDRKIIERVRNVLKAEPSETTTSSEEMSSRFGESQQVVILFADNDSDFLASRSEFLRAEGYTVVTATSPDEARRVVKETPIDIAILDLRLTDDNDPEDISGLKLAEDEAFRYIPKIITSSFPTITAVQKALGPVSNGLPLAQRFIAKQDGLAALIQAIGEVTKVTKASRSSLPELFTDFERDLRTLVDEVMQPAYGTSWPSQLEIGRDSEHLSLGQLLKVVTDQRPIFETVFTQPADYDRLIATAKDVVTTRNTLAHRGPEPEISTLRYVQNTIRELLAIIRSATTTRKANTAPLEGFIQLLVEATRKATQEILFVEIVRRIDRAEELSSLPLISVTREAAKRGVVTKIVYVLVNNQPLSSTLDTLAPFSITDAGIEARLVQAQGSVNESTFVIYDSSEAYQNVGLLEAHVTFEKTTAPSVIQALRMRFEHWWERAQEVSLDTSHVSASGLRLFASRHSGEQPTSYIEFPIPPRDSSQKRAQEVKFLLYLENPTQTVAKYIVTEMSVTSDTDFFWAYDYTRDPLVIEESPYPWHITLSDTHGHCLLEGGPDFACHSREQRNLGLVKMLVPYGQPKTDLTFQYRVQATGLASEGSFIVRLIPMNMEAEEEHFLNPSD